MSTRQKITVQAGEDGDPITITPGAEGYLMIRQHDDIIALSPEAAQLMWRLLAILSGGQS